MKKFISPILFFLCCFLFLCGSALAITMADVGGIDPWKSYTSLSVPNESNAKGWIEGELEGDDWFISDPFAATWQQIGGSGSTVWATSLEGAPEYFYIFLAPGQEPKNNAWLYKNEPELTWAVIDISEWEGIYEPPGTPGGINIGRISHLRAIGVPEPATGLLLGVALFGIGIISRKKLIR
jgi:hypothetical protein